MATPPYNEARPVQAWLRDMGKLTKPPANILELPLAERAEMALKAAVEKVVEAHIRDGRPISIWRDGKVVEVSAQELRDTPAKPQ
jgi:hypothetical protein